MSESECRFVSSRGILKSCKYRSAFPESTTPYVDYEVETDMFPFIKSKPATHYVCTYALVDFANRILPTLKKPIILVSGDSDVTVPTDNRDAASQILNSPMIVAWLSQNCVGGHPKLHQIPIGMDYHTLTRGAHAWGDAASPIQQEKELLAIREKAPHLSSRKPECYANFQFLMGTRYAAIDRVDAQSSIPADLIYYEPTPVPRRQTWETMSQYAFVPSPHGNGLDCHRTWEALALGCIPIVRTSKLDPLFDGLPVWIVRDWTEVTRDTLSQVLREFQGRSFAMERLTLAFWTAKINTFKE